ncbi:MAG: c-type cytochrome [Verrucomicrobia bacterium]|nr:c-type cytochrome [Verrucomicrobiota bacterium]
MKTKALFLSTLIASSTLCAYEKVETIPPGFKMPKPLPLAESVATVKARPGLKVELIAAEPMVMDPISLDWGPDGKLWVVEMADYPLGTDGAPGGRVRFLEDTNGDGKYDKSTLFMEGLRFPTAVKAWRNGAIIVAAPEVFYAEDSDHDGKADKKTVLFTGFREGNQQHRVNTLAWGLDNWLHLANGDSGGKVVSAKTGKSVELGGFDLRINPDSGDIELETGRTQNGRTRDDWGNWYGCNNSRPLYQFVLPDAWLRRNPHITYPGATHQVPKYPTFPRIYPAGETAARFNVPSAANRITSACGLSIHRDPRLGAEFNGNAFVCEPVHNLVHREVFAPVTTIARRSHRAKDESESEFLSSTDNWFRPTSALTGPDGAVWVTDMHRYVIEHPEWIPKVWQEVLNLRAGSDRGRIYRVVSEKTGSAVPPILTEKSIPELVSLLASENGWTRDTAHQMLLWKNEVSALPQLDKLLQTNPQALARLHALCVLDGLNLLNAQHIAKGLTDKHPGVRRHAVRLSEQFASKNPELLKSLLSLSDDSDADVQFQLALALGEWPGTEAGKTLATLALSHSKNSFFAAAAMSSLPLHLTTVSETLANTSPELTYALLPYVMETALASNNQAAVNNILTIGKDKDMITRFAVYANFLNVIDRRNIDLDTYHKNASPPLKATLDSAAELSKAARNMATDIKVSTKNRISALTILARNAEDRKTDINTLASLLSPQSPTELQRAASLRLAESGQIATLLAVWSQSTPSLRASIVSQCLNRKNDTMKLLQAIEDKKIAAASIDAAGRDRLIRYKDKKIQARAEKIFKSSTNNNREAVVDKFASSLKLKGDPAKGKPLFAALCSVCHQLDGIGRHIGPDLTALSDNSSSALLIAILDPNRAIEDKYLLYSITLNDGESLAGMIIEESGGSLTLQILDGTKRSLLRSEIKTLESIGLSAMPEGLEAALDPQKLADVLAYVQAIAKKKK